MDFIIGVDIGTSGTKAVGFSKTGMVTDTAYVAYDPVLSTSTLHEQDPEVLFQAVISCLQQAIQQVQKTGNVAGICFSSAMHGLMAVDVEGKPLTNLVTWVDQRSTAYAEQLKDTETGKRIYRHTGTPIHPMSPLCKLMWMQEQEPGIMAAAYKFIAIKEYIFHRLFEQYLVDHSLASGTGLFDIRSKNWYAASLQTAGISEDHLSKPVSTTFIVKGLKKEYCQLLSLNEDTPFIPGASDGCLANLGSNAVHPGDLAVTIGTSAAVRMISEHPNADEQQRVFNYILTDTRYVTGGPINNGVLLLKWYSEKFLHRPFTSGSDLEWFVQEAATVPAGCNSLLFLPYLQGERAPVWDARAKGVFLGVNGDHTPQHFMRAIIEGINYALYQVAESVQETVGPIQAVFASGGFIRSQPWLQWLADLFGKKIGVSGKADASAIGAGILGMQALGMLSTGESLPQFQIDPDYFYPDEQHRVLYQQYYCIYKSVYPDLKERLHQLHSMAQSPGIPQKIL